MTGRLDDTCRVCHDAIRWAKTQAGKAIPLQPYPEAGGNCVVTTAKPLTVRVLHKGETAPAGAKTYRAHFAACPRKKTPRKRRPVVEQTELALTDEGV